MNNQSVAGELCKKCKHFFCLSRKCGECVDHDPNSSVCICWMESEDGKTCKYFEEAEDGSNQC